MNLNKLYFQVAGSLCAVYHNSMRLRCRTFQLAKNILCMHGHDFAITCWCCQQPILHMNHFSSFVHHFFSFISSRGLLFVSVDFSVKKNRANFLLHLVVFFALCSVAVSSSSLFLCIFCTPYSRPKKTIMLDELFIARSHEWLIQKLNTFSMQR